MRGRLEIGQRAADDAYVDSIEQAAESGNEQKEAVVAGLGVRNSGRGRGVRNDMGHRELQLQLYMTWQGDSRTKWCFMLLWLLLTDAGGQLSAHDTTAHIPLRIECPRVGWPLISGIVGSEWAVH